jgi:hypothetical protein
VVRLARQSEPQGRAVRSSRPIGGVGSHVLGHIYPTS